MGAVIIEEWQEISNAENFQDDITWKLQKQQKNKKTPTKKKKKNIFLINERTGKGHQLLFRMEFVFWKTKWGKQHTHPETKTEQKSPTYMQIMGTR